MSKVHPQAEQRRELPDRVLEVILSNGLLKPGERVLVAVSGGLDSMVLLHLLVEGAQTNNWRIVVGHFNHQLRGTESDGDEAFVRKWAKAMGVAIRVGRGDVRAFARERGLSLEMAARQLRHRFLAQSAHARGIRKVALGHHSDDQVELFFMRVLRGAGPQGLSGMKLSSPSPVDPRVRLIRPLLPLRRMELESYAREHRIAFRTDSTNAQHDYARNRIRHRLLPYLRRHFQTALDQTVRRTIDLISSESDFVEEEVRKLDLSEAGPFQNWHVALQRRWLQAQCLRLGFTPDYDLIEKLRLRTDQTFMVKPGKTIWRDARGEVCVGEWPSAQPEPEAREIELSGKPGQIRYAGVIFSWRIQPWKRSTGVLLSRTAGLERFDADKIGRWCRLRHWRAGDRFQPIGMPAPVKLQDLFTNARVPRHFRSKLVLAENVDGIFWIQGLRISEQAKIDDRTRHCLEWRWEETEATAR